MLKMYNSIIKHIFSGRNTQTNIRRVKKKIQNKISKSNTITCMLVITKRIFVLQTTDSYSFVEILAGSIN